MHRNYFSLLKNKLWYKLWQQAVRESCFQLAETMILTFQKPNSDHQPIFVSQLFGDKLMFAWFSRYFIF
jgi:hypothetical protein